MSIKPKVVFMCPKILVASFVIWQGRTPRVSLPESVAVTNRSSQESSAPQQATERTEPLSDHKQVKNRGTQPEPHLPGQRMSPCASSELADFGKLFTHTHTGSCDHQARCSTTWKQVEFNKSTSDVWNDTMLSVIGILCCILLCPICVH